MVHHPFRHGVFRLRLCDVLWSGDVILCEENRKSRGFCLTIVPLPILKRPLLNDSVNPGYSEFSGRQMALFLFVSPNKNHVHVFYMSSLYELTVETPELSIHHARALSMFLDRGGQVCQNAKSLT